MLITKATSDDELRIISDASVNPELTKINIAANYRAFSDEEKLE